MVLLKAWFVAPIINFIKFQPVSSSCLCNILFDEYSLCKVTHKTAVACRKTQIELKRKQPCFSWNIFVWKNNKLVVQTWVIDSHFSEKQLIVFASAIWTFKKKLEFQKTGTNHSELDNFCIPTGFLIVWVVTLMNVT